ncbi:fimbrial protein [Enterobacter sp. DRP3]|nr:fimbrial protein [Enterobacter sp. DRP3]
MTIKKIVLAMAVGAAFTAGFANAADQGAGSVAFTGSIIDAPCSITSDTANQTVDLGEVANSALKAGQTSTPKTFNIQLEQCDTATLKSVQALFTGNTDTNDNNLLALSGSAKGAGIAIEDGSQQLVKFDGKTASSKLALQPGTNTMVFTAYVKSDGASEVVPGDFTSVTNFSLQYN